MIARRLPPAHSPLSAAALAAGAVAALSVDDARARLAALLRRHWGARDFLLVDSGTTALSLALRAAVAERPGAPVALPAYGCYDLATAAQGAGAAVVLYDVDARTLAPCGTSLDRALARGPAAVVLVHPCGLPVDVAAWAERIARAGALTVEDAAQGTGARIHGRPAGAAGSLAVLSFGRGKGLTGGGGGALLAGDAAGEAVLWRARRRVPEQGGSGWRELAGAAAQWAVARPRLFGLAAALPWLHLGETVHHAPWPPAPIAATSAALVVAGWAASQREGALRRRHAERLLAAAVRGGAGRAFPVPAGCQAGWLRLPLLAGEEMRRHVSSPEAARLGVMPGYPRALCDLPGFGAGCLNAGDDFAGARELARGLVTLPTHGLLGPRDLAALERWLAGTGTAAERSGDAVAALVAG